MRLNPSILKRKATLDKAVFGQSLSTKSSGLAHAAGVMREARAFTHKN